MSGYATSTVTIGMPSPMEVVQEKIYKKPSVVVRALIAGINKGRDRDDFEFDMKTFGRTQNGRCVGCAATCALQEMFNVRLDVSNIDDRKLAYGTVLNSIDRGNLEELEYAVDLLRKGYTFELYRVCYVTALEEAALPAGVPALPNAAQHVNWRGPVMPSDNVYNFTTAIARFEKLAELLEAAGF